MRIWLLILYDSRFLNLYPYLIRWFMWCVFIIFIIRFKIWLCSFFVKYFEIWCFWLEIKSHLRSISLLELLYASSLHCLFFCLNRCIFSTFTSSFSKLYFPLYTFLFLSPLFFYEALFLFILSPFFFLPLSLFFFQPLSLFLLPSKFSSHFFILLLLFFILLDSYIHNLWLFFSPDCHLFLESRIKLSIKSKLLLFLCYLALFLHLVHLFDNLSTFNCSLHIWWQVSLCCHTSACNLLKFMLNCQFFYSNTVKDSIRTLAWLLSHSLQFICFFRFLCNMMGEKVDIMISLWLILLVLQLFITKLFFFFDA